MSPDEFLDSEVSDATNPKLLTFYFPQTPEATRAAGLNPRVEGGTQGGGRFGNIDLRNHTIEQYNPDDPNSVVAVAMPGEPSGKRFPLNVNGKIVRAWNIDTGGGLVDGQIDIATSNPRLAKSPPIRSFPKVSIDDFLGKPEATPTTVDRSVGVRAAEPPSEGTEIRRAEPLPKSDQPSGKSPVEATNREKVTLSHPEGSPEYEAAIRDFQLRQPGMLETAVNTAIPRFNLDIKPPLQPEEVANMPLEKVAQFVENRVGFTPGESDAIAKNFAHYIARPAAAFIGKDPDEVEQGLIQPLSKTIYSATRPEMLLQYPFLSNPIGQVWMASQVLANSPNRVKQWRDAKTGEEKTQAVLDTAQDALILAPFVHSMFKRPSAPIDHFLEQPQVDTTPKEPEVIPESAKPEAVAPKTTEQKVQSLTARFQPATQAQTQLANLRSAADQLRDAGLAVSDQIADRLFAAEDAIAKEPALETFPQDVTGQIATSPVSATPGDVAVGQQPTGEAIPVSVGARPQTGRAGVSGGLGVTGVSRAARAASGEVDVTPAEVMSPEDHVQNGERLERSGADPERVVGSAVAQKSFSRDAVDLAVNRDTKLTEAARRAQREADARPDDATAQKKAADAIKAQQRWEDFAIRPIRGQFAETGRSLQTAIDLDTGDYVDYVKAFRKSQGRQPNPAEAAALNKTARGIRELNRGTNDVAAKLEGELRKATKPTKTLKNFTELKASLDKLKANLLKGCDV